jgi:HTH-type transcriptional regulator/antitoxin HipB
MNIRGTKQLGQAIRNNRKQQGLTQEKLSQLAAILPKTISAIENGSERVEIASIFAVISALELDIVIQPRTRLQNKKAVTDGN